MIFLYVKSNTNFYNNLLWLECYHKLERVQLTTISIPRITVTRTNSNTHDTYKIEKFISMHNIQNHFSRTIQITEKDISYFSHKKLPAVR